MAVTSSCRVSKTYFLNFILIRIKQEYECKTFCVTFSCEILHPFMKQNLFPNQSSEIKMQESTDNFSMIKRPTHNAI